MSAARSVLDVVFNWLAVNARSFSYALPDSVELALYVIVAAYFTASLALQKT